jgi:hypothetical protein
MSTKSALMVEWGMPVEGREMKAMEEFTAHLEWWSSLKQKGQIADFKLYGPVTGNIHERAGFVIVEGTDEQIDKLRVSEDFRTRLNNVIIVGHNIEVTLLETGDAMMTRMQRYGKSLQSKL